MKSYDNWRMCWSRSLALALADVNFEASCVSGRICLDFELDPRPHSFFFRNFVLYCRRQRWRWTSERESEALEIETFRVEAIFTSSTAERRVRWIIDRAKLLNKLWVRRWVNSFAQLNHKFVSNDVTDDDLLELVANWTRKQKRKNSCCRSEHVVSRFAVLYKEKKEYQTNLARQSKKSLKNVLKFHFVKLKTDVHTQRRDETKKVQFENNWIEEEAAKIVRNCNDLETYEMSIKLALSRYDEYSSELRNLVRFNFISLAKKLSEPDETWRGNDQDNTQCRATARHTMCVVFETRSKNERKKSFIWDGRRRAAAERWMASTDRLSELFFCLSSSSLISSSLADYSLFYAIYSL